MSLITKKDIFLILIQNLTKKSFFKLLIQSARIQKINKFYNQYKNETTDSFIDKVLNKYSIRYTINTIEIQRIPENKPVIFIANHPYGGVDALVLYKIISTQQKDLKILASSVYKKIAPLSEILIPINSINETEDNIFNHSSIKAAYKHLQNGGSLLIFPAGEQTKISSHRKLYSDNQWHHGFIKFIAKAGFPVIPLFLMEEKKFYKKFLQGHIISVRNRGIFMQEIFFRRNMLLNIRIGKLIPYEQISSFESISQLGRFLRVKTYALSSPLDVNKFYLRDKKGYAETIVSPVPVELLEKEIKSLTKETLLFKINTFKVYCSPAIKIPNILNEIGRLREITFRQVKEGTNKSIDLDEYDLYYHHLFIWDDNAKKIVGAYRIGKGKEILSQYGIKGFYIQTLFYIKEEFFPILEQSLELGRSFIVEEYQQKPLPLFLLWKGILYFLLKNNNYRYLIGPVSISNSYSNVSKSLIIEFIKRYYFNNEYVDMVIPRTPFDPNLPEIDITLLLSNTTNNLDQLDKIIEDIEINNFKIPVLLKKYLKLNAKILGFNLDPDFNDTLDGLILLDLYNVPPDIIFSLSKEFNDDEILQRFKSAEV